jgi:hypothetical protein
MKEILKKELWEAWNTADLSAGTDKTKENSGISSQTFWEYDYVVDNLPCTAKNSGSLLFVGCRGDMLLPALLRKHCRCIIVDPFIEPKNEDDIKSDLNEKLAEKLNREDINAVICISVTDYSYNKKTLMQLLDLIEAPLIMTFQFGSEPSAFEHQLTNKSLYEMSRVIKNHHISRFEKCPILQNNGNGKRWPVGLLFLPA